jgi:hypothetical protein
METNNPGSNWGNCINNIDMQTGIHYGVIHQNEVCQAWSDSSEPYYFPACPYCGNEIEQSIIDECQNEETKTCPHCEKQLEDTDFQEQEASSYYIDDNEYSAECSDGIDIFISKSPYYTMCQYCSPCAPNAGYIMNECDSGIKSYCFGHDWFEEGKAPYTVYSVKTNEIIKPK